MRSGDTGSVPIERIVHMLQRQREKRWTRKRAWPGLRHGDGKVWDMSGLRGSPGMAGSGDSVGAVGQESGRKVRVAGEMCANLEAEVSWVRNPDGPTCH